MVLRLVEFEKQPHVLKAVVDLFINMLLEVLDGSLQVDPQIVHPFVVVQDGDNRPDDSQDREGNANYQCQNLRISRLNFSCWLISGLSLYSSTS